MKNGEAPPMKANQSGDDAFPVALGGGGGGNEANRGVKKSSLAFFPEDQGEAEEQREGTQCPQSPRGSRRKEICFTRRSQEDI